MPYCLQDKLQAGKPYYEIRLESIGGLGANLCGKMLGELGLKYLDLNSTSFSSYGSEKTGTPVKGYIRLCNKDKEIRVHYPVVEPDLLVVFHQALLKDDSVWKGCGEDTAIIVALEPGQETVPELRGRKGTVYGLEAQRIAIETKSRINVVMLGATLKLMGLEDTQVGEEICKATLGKKYPDALAGNIEGMRRGFKEVRQLELDGFIYDENDEKGKKQCCGDDEIKPYWGYENAPIGGINPRFGNTVLSDLSPSRQGFIPLFIKDRCINCGLCHTTCPDMVFQFAKGEFKGREMMVNQRLDYYHCKGCLRCVDVCPVNALVRGVESEHPNKEYFMANQELIRTPDYYEKSGSDGYITSESYLTEKRMEGGEV
ncbi:MAG: 2-oxoacid:acceptor oxidoreductase family protein [Lachnospiraceae bacterium]|nr:2-oxoacid:acceptor oxidoreductase family protein [Lachnospiraceae bacterium]